MGMIGEEGEFQLSNVDLFVLLDEFFESRRNQLGFLTIHMALKL